MTERSGLAPDELERLAFLAEECGEIVQAIGKIQRHGYDNTNPDEPAGRTNRERLAKERLRTRSSRSRLVLAAGR